MPDRGASYREPFLSLQRSAEDQAELGGGRTEKSMMSSALLQRPTSSESLVDSWTQRRQEQPNFR